MALGPCLFLNFPAFENKKYTAYDRFHGNGPYGKIPTKKEPIRKLGFALPYNKKTYSTARAECMCGIVKRTAEWNFSNLEISVFLNLRKIYSAEFFLIFPVSSFECNKKIFFKKIWGHRLSF